MIEQLKIINNSLIEKSINNPNEYKKYLLIKEILNEENSFLNMEIEYAYSILRDLNIPESQIKYIYEKLINIS